MGCIMGGMRPHMLLCASGFVGCVGQGGPAGGVGPWQTAPVNMSLPDCWHVATGGQLQPPEAVAAQLGRIPCTRGTHRSPRPPSPLPLARCCPPALLPQAATRPATPRVHPSPSPSPSPQDLHPGISRHILARPLAPLLAVLVEREVLQLNRCPQSFGRCGRRKAERKQRGTAGPARAGAGAALYREEGEGRMRGHALGVGHDWLLVSACELPGCAPQTVMLFMLWLLFAGR